MDTLKELTFFFKYPAKHKHILHDHLLAQKNFLADCVEGDLVPAKMKYVPRASSAFQHKVVDTSLLY